MDRKIIIGILATILCLPNMLAQTSKISDLEEDLKRRCVETVNAYTYHVEKIASKNNSDPKKDEEIKDEHILAALEYFVGKGDGIKLLDKYGNPIMEDGAYKFQINPPKIEITSRYRETRRSYIKTYLRALKSLPYEKVSISSSNAYFVSNLRQKNENEFEAVLGYCQIFKGSNGEWEICDIDDKRTRLRIIKEVYADGKERWKVEMGDIYARSIEHK